VNYRLGRYHSLDRRIGRNDGLKPRRKTRRRDTWVGQAAQLALLFIAAWFAAYELIRFAGL
jgi:hypothetical protein